MIENSIGKWRKHQITANKYARSNSGFTFSSTNIENTISAIIANIDHAARGANNRTIGDGQRAAAPIIIGVTTTDIDVPRRPFRTRTRNKNGASGTGVLADCNFTGLNLRTIGNGHCSLAGITDRQHAIHCQA